MTATGRGPGATGAGSAPGADSGPGATVGAGASWVDALRTPAGAAALVAATAVAGRDPLAAASALRAAGLPADLATAALTQAALRLRGAAKFGPDAAVMFFTRAGLEQATRGVVAARRAERLAGCGATRVADLGCGIGADAAAFARAGLAVLAAEIDPVTAAVAHANLAALGHAATTEVVVADAATVLLDGVDAVFCDPARRTGRGRVFDPAHYSPPWTFVAGLPSRVPATALKLAPGIDHGLLPPGSEAEWVSVDGDLVETACWCGPLARVPRRATVLRTTATAPGAVAPGAVAHELTGSGAEPAPLAAPGRHLFDPDAAVVRSHLVAEFAATVDGTIADPTIAYVYADRPAATPFARCYEVLDELPVALKRLRAALRVRNIGSLTILKRGSAHDVERLRHDLRLSGTDPATLVLTRIAGSPAALLCRPVPG